VGEEEGNGKECVVQERIVKKGRNEKRADMKMLYCHNTADYKVYYNKKEWVFNASQKRQGKIQFLKQW